MLLSGCFFFFGRDKHFRPIFILKPVCLMKIEGNISDKVKAEAIIFSNWYAKKNMLLPGKIESWVVIYDLENTPFFSIPIMTLVGIGKQIVENFKCIGAKFFVVNVCSACALAWSGVQLFITETQREKTSIFKENTCQEMLDLIP